MSKQFATPDELSEITLILKNLTELGRLLGEREAIVSLGDPTLYDSNGEILGYATWHAGQYVFTLDGKIE